MTRNVSGATNGWISIGIGPSMKMSPADDFVFWVSDTTGVVTALDTWSPNYNQVCRRMHARMHARTHTFTCCMHTSTRAIYL